MIWLLSGLHMQNVKPNYSWFINFAEWASVSSSKTTKHTVMQICRRQSYRDRSSETPMRLWYLIAKIFANNHSAKIVNKL